MKVKIEGRELGTISFEEMKVGQIGTIEGSSYHGEVVLRFYNGVVSLSTPNRNWGQYAGHRVIPRATEYNSNPGNGGIASCAA